MRTFQGQHHPQASNWISPPGAQVSPAQFLGAPNRPNSLPPRPTHDNRSISAFVSPSPMAPPFIPHQHLPLTGPHDWRSHGLSSPSYHLHSPSTDHRSTSPFSAESSDNRSAHPSGGIRRNRRTDDPDGLRPKYKPRVGGPPKAKLGGPGGKTYDEMAAEAMARKPSSEISAGSEAAAGGIQGGKGTGGVVDGCKQDKDSEKQEERHGKWRGKPIEFKPPPTRCSPPDSATGIPLPPSPPARTETLERPPYEAGTLSSKWAKKPISFAVPDEAAWERLKAPSKSSEINHDSVSPAAIPLPESDDDEPPSPPPSQPPSRHRAGGSVDLVRAHAIREPPSRRDSVDKAEQNEQIVEIPPLADQDQEQPLTASSTSSETRATPLRRTGAFVGNAAFLRKQLGGVLRPDRAATPGRHARLSSSDGARRVLLESSVRPSAVSLHSVEVQVGDTSSSNVAPPAGPDGNGDAANLVEVPLTASTETSTVFGLELSAEGDNTGISSAIATPQASVVPIGDIASRTITDPTTPSTSNAAADGEGEPGGESPVSRAMRLIQSSLTSSRSSQSTSGKRKQSELSQEPVESPPVSPTKSSTVHTPPASRIDRASIGPKMGRYLQGQLSGFLKPKAQRSRLSSSPGTVLHGLDAFTATDIEHSATPGDNANESSSSADQISERMVPTEPQITLGRTDAKVLPPLGDGSALGLFTFTSTLRPSAGTFRSAAARLEQGDVDDEPTIRKKPALRPTAPAFAPVGPRPQSRRESVGSEDMPHKRLRGNAPVFNPSTSGHTSRQSLASIHGGGSPVKLAFPSPAKSNASLQLRPSAAAFVPSHFAQSSVASLAPPSPRASIGEAAPFDWDATIRRGSAQEPADIFFASKAMRADATSFVPSELPLSPTSGKRTLSSSTLKALESWLEKASTGTHTPAIGSLAPSTAVSPRSIAPRALADENSEDVSVEISEREVVSRASSPAGSPPYSPAIGDLSVTFGRRDLVRSAAPSPDSRRPLPEAVPTDAIGGGPEEAAVDAQDLFYRPPVESDETASADDVISPTKHSSPGHILYRSPPPLASPLAVEPVVSPPSSAPTFRQAEIKVDTGADDRRFRKWVFPVSPLDRPPTLRRHTMPIPDQDPPALSPDAETTLSSRLEELRETLGRGLSKGKQRPPIPFSGGVAHDGVEKKLEELGEMLKDVQQSALERPRDALKAEELRPLLLELEGSILSALHDANDDKNKTQSGELARIVTLLQDQAAAISTLQENSGVVADVHADIWTIDASHKTAMAELSTAQEQAIASATANRSQAANEMDKLLDKVTALEVSQRGIGESMKDMVESQPVLEELQARIRTLEQERSAAQSDTAALREKMDLDEKRHRVVESKLSSLKSKLEVAETREGEVRKDWEEVLAGKMAAERARDELAEAMVVHIETMRSQRDEITRLAQELEMEKAKPPPPPVVDHGAERMDGMQTAIGNLQRDLMAQFGSLSPRSDEQARAKDAESTRLVEQNKKLHSQVADLRDQLEALRAEKSEAKLQSQTDLQSARSEIETLRAQLQQANAAHQSAELKASEAEEGNKRVTEELLDSRMIARDRQAACRMNEALAQETHYWRHFALAYDRKEYRAFMTQNPNLRKSERHAKDASPELKTPGEAQLHRSTVETPTKRMAPILETPSLVHSSDSSLDL